MAKQQDKSVATDYTQRELFVAFNNHSRDCQPPPKFTNRDTADDKKPRPDYHGYFENQYGEQFVFIYDFGKEKARLYGGDCGWKKELKIDVMPLDKIEDNITSNGKTPEEFREFKQKHLDTGRGFGAYITVQVRHDSPEVVLAVRGVNMNAQEMNWLKACWMTVQHFRDVRDSKFTANGQ